MGTSRSGLGTEKLFQEVILRSTTPRLYGRRKGRPLRVRKSRLMEELLPKLQIELPDSFLKPASLFSSKSKQIWLEVGFGGGEHLAAQAKLHPDIGFIGCEPFVNGIASALDHIDREQLTNIRIFPDDARPLIEKLPDASIARCFVLFADPWPKSKHANRRFIGNDTILDLARVLTKGAELRLATDDPRLKIWIKNHLDAAKDFKPTHHSEQSPADWVSTRYEEKALKAGRNPLYFDYKRI